jgi:hypothetical protein
MHTPDSDATAALDAFAMSLDSATAIIGDELFLVDLSRFTE